MAHIEVHNAAAISPQGWRLLQAVQRGACLATLDQSQTEIDAFVDWDNPDRYYASHVNPNSEVGHRFAAGQEYTHPRVAIAYDEQRWPVGFMYAANNVSGGSDRERQLKRLSVVKNYLWLREVAVAPDHQGQGIATKLSRAILDSAMALQPPAAYVMPTITPGLRAKLESKSFTVTGEDEARPFGENSPTVPLLRMQADSVRAVRKSL